MSPRATCKSAPTGRACAPIGSTAKAMTISLRWGRFWCRARSCRITRICSFGSPSTARSSRTAILRSSFSRPRSRSNTPLTFSASRAAIFSAAALAAASAKAPIPSSRPATSWRLRSKASARCATASSASRNKRHRTAWIVRRICARFFASRGPTRPGRDNDSGNVMQLSPSQLKEFDEQGYLFFPNCFSEEEIALLRDDAEAILKLDRREVWREKSGAPRTAFAAHTFNETFRLLACHPRLVEPLRQLFGEDVYVHQFKLNAKAAFEGDVWQWHQDYGTWARDDGMPQPRAMNIAVFLDEVMPINGPLLLIPKSHKQGVLNAGHDTLTTSYPLWTLDKETVTRLAAEGGIVAPTGKPGSVLMFHGNLVHASPPNITPYPRKIVYLTLCACSNHITKFTRPEFIAHRDFTPIVPVDDDALVEYARAHRVAAE